MSVILVFMAVITGVALWWLAQQRVMSKPWLEVGAGAALDGRETTGLPTAKIALGVFLAVVGALFALFASAYFMRMDLDDWRQVPLPPLIWVNTVMLVLASVVLQTARVAVRGDDEATVRLTLVTGTVATTAFLVGQVLAWRELVGGGYLLAVNPANSFFYLLTGLHGLHILGGLVGLGWTTAGVWGDVAPERVRLRVDLCAMYAHFLLFLWAAMLVLFTGWADDFIEICRQILT
jgi:cytochrome c oxidase subunit III